MKKIPHNFPFSNFFKISQGLILAFLFSIGLASCSKFSKTGDSASSATDDTLRIPIVADAKTFDPIHVEEVYSHYMASLVYEGLYEYHFLKRPHEIIPLIAEGMPQISKDGLTYTIKIKKGIHFADHEVFEGGKGREVKADDFIYSWLRIADPKTANGSYWLFDGHIKGLDEWRDVQKKLEKTNYDSYPDGFVKVDDYTIRIQLAHKYPQLIFILAMPQTAVVAREAVQKLGVDFVNKPVGTGPYLLSDWQRNSKVSFVKNPTYRGGVYPTEGEAGDKEKGLLEDAGKTIPFVSKVEYLVFVEDSTRWLTFLKGGSDYTDIPKDYFKEAVTSAPEGPGRVLTEEFKKKGVTLSFASEPDVTYIAFNMEHPVIQKGGPHLRKAISHAIDSEKTIDLFYNGRAIKAHSPIPPGIAGYDPDLRNPYKEFSLEKAKEELKLAGFPEGKGFPEIEYEGTTGASSRQMAERVQADLAKIGLKVKVNLNQFSELNEKLNQKRAMMWGIAWLGDYPDVENFLQLLYGKNKAPGPNAANYDNPKYNALYEKIRGMTDSPERRKLISEAIKIYVQDMPWIVETHRIIYRLEQPWVKNSKGGFLGGSPAKYMRVDVERRAKGIQ
jgi:oligopeptide transport system substrate-binding protein